MKIYLVFSEPHNAAKYWDEERYEDAFISEEKAQAFIESCNDRGHRTYSILEELVK